MSVRVELPGGQWAELCDPADVPERFVRPIRTLVGGLSHEVRKAMDPAAIKAGTAPGLTDVATEADIEVLLRGNDLAICALVVAWSFETTCRPTLDVVLDLPAGVYGALVEATAPGAAQMISGLDVSPPSPAEMASGEAANSPT